MAFLGGSSTKLAARVVAVLDERDLDDFEQVARKILAAFDPPGEA